MMRAEILTPLVGTGEGEKGTPFYPHVAAAYALIRWQDVTGQPSANLPADPNLYIILAEMTDAILADIEADATYEVLWSEPINEPGP